MDPVSKREKIELKALVEEYVPLAIRTLVNVMRTGETDRDRVTAAKEILDRAYGRPLTQVKPGDGPEDTKNEEVSSNAERFTSAIASIASKPRP